MSRLTVSILGLLAVAAAGSTTVQAATPDGIAQVRLEFSRRALNDPASAQQFYRQVRQAAAKVCSATNSRSGDLQQYARWQECYRQTLHDAITTIDAPVLLALYGGSSRHPSG